MINKEQQRPECSHTAFDRLRYLIHTAEQSFAAESYGSAQGKFIELSMFLAASTKQGLLNPAYARGIQLHVHSRLSTCALALQTNREQLITGAVRAAGLPDDFTFRTAEEDNLIEDLRASDVFRDMAQSMTQVLQQCDQVQICSTSSKQAQVVQQPASQRPRAVSVPLAANVRPEHNTQLAPPEQRCKTSAQHSEQRDRKRDARGNLKGSGEKNKWAPHAQYRRNALDATPNSEDEASDVIEIDEADESPGSVKESCKPEAFQTARALLLRDMQRKRGAKQVDLRDYSSGNRFTAVQPGLTSNGPRVGLSRPARATSGGGSATVAACGGVRGSFIPPFVRKAVEAQNGGEEEAGPLSARSMELLAGADGKLPDLLARLDPATLELVCNEILDQRSNVAWDDIAGQEQAKRLLQELVVWPMLNPHLFKGARAPPKGLLLFGPPGTGKTLLGKAIASNLQSTFFNISASSLTSKWIGEGEKMVRTLFAVAGCMQPAVIFIDEIDSLLSARKSEGEHEASRRLKTELLIQMEGCDPNSAERRVLLVGATNRPSELDEAARRRMPKQLYIALPCAKARLQMISRLVGPGGSIKAELSSSDTQKIVDKTAGYSGSDMRNLIQEACQGPVRDAVAKHGSALQELSEDDLRPVILRDFQVAAKAQRASVEPAEIQQYEAYDRKHGACYTAAHEPADDDW